MIRTTRMTAVQQAKKEKLIIEQKVIVIQQAWLQVEGNGSQRVAAMIKSRTTSITFFLRIRDDQKLRKQIRILCPPKITN